MLDRISFLSVNIRISTTDLLWLVKLSQKATLNQLLSDMFPENFPDALGMRYRRGHSSKQQPIIQKPDLLPRNTNKGQSCLVSGRKALNIHH